MKFVNGNQSRKALTFLAESRLSHFDVDYCSEISLQKRNEVCERQSTSKCLTFSEGVGLLHFDVDYRSQISYRKHNEICEQ